MAIANHPAQIAAQIRSSIAQGSTSAVGSGRSYAFDAIQHQLRSLKVQYGSGGGQDVRQLQLVITGQKGVILDLEKQGQDAQAVSKEFFLWGQTEDTDIKDVSDRLAYLTFVQGSLAQSLASSLDAARAPLKALRDAEAALQPKRNIRNGYELQISRLRNEGKSGTEGKIRELETMLNHAVKADEPHEREVELLKRKALLESEKSKWEAIREYGEKLVLIAEASKPILEVLPSVPPTAQHPYTGAASTASTRALLQKALDTYKPGSTTLPIPTSVDAETRSFGETHASELSRISSVADHRPPPPRRDSSPEPGVAPSSHVRFDTPVSTGGLSQTSAGTPSTPVNPNALNNAPAPIPSTNASEPIPSVPVSEFHNVEGSPAPATISPAGPTVAETGVPVVAGKEGPGPAKGSLASIAHRNSQSSGSNVPTGPGYGESAPGYGGLDGPKFGLIDSRASSTVVHESAEDEKKRLEREERERVLRGLSGNTFAGPSATSGSGAAYETAEEEKKRLQREERERILAGEAASAAQSPPRRQDTEDFDDVPPPPAYEEPQ
ncbi:hypothetical protein M422DRAFT_75767 [Sphaerobolus stellatus SS14]|uniref:Sphingolipid long chain base-responsive protein LSP1 n=1 Tax=Sphaerobolus stellatus (strain SS14) TaxID=990650 RepID=A0A0C9VQM5_SPHS4|nr:hypothetical protein M422DRAFT_75767 [Sphaerobolus stellatus SS14]